jgi:hypothetical protein
MAASTVDRIAVGMQESPPAAADVQLVHDLVSLLPSMVTQLSGYLTLLRSQCASAVGSPRVIRDVAPVGLAALNAAVANVLGQLERRGAVAAVGRRAASSPAGTPPSALTQASAAAPRTSARSATRTVASSVPATTAWDRIADAAQDIPALALDRVGSGLSQRLATQTGCIRSLATTSDTSTGQPSVSWQQCIETGGELVELAQVWLAALARRCGQGEFTANERQVASERATELRLWTEATVTRLATRAAALCPNPPEQVLLHETALNLKHAVAAMVVQEAALQEELSGPDTVDDRPPAYPFEDEADVAAATDEYDGMDGGDTLLCEEPLHTPTDLDPTYPFATLDDIHRGEQMDWELTHAS